MVRYGMALLAFPCRPPGLGSCRAIALTPLRAVTSCAGRRRAARPQKLLYLSSGSSEGVVGVVFGEDVVDLAGDVALEPSEDVEVGLAIG